MEKCLKFALSVDLYSVPWDMGISPAERKGLYTLTHTHKHTHTPRPDFLKGVNIQAMLYHSGKKGNKLYPNNDDGEDSKNAPLSS